MMKPDDTPDDMLVPAEKRNLELYLASSAHPLDFEGMWK